MKFDVVLTNPPFQDSVNRKKTPHKLWIDFTLQVFERYIEDGGSLIQVSPASFASPSNRVLQLMNANITRFIRFDTAHHFTDVGSTFSDYWIVKGATESELTSVSTADGSFKLPLNGDIHYLPNDLGELSLAIHRKVMFESELKLGVRWDYVVAHNIRRHDNEPTLVTSQDEGHPYPVFHTNRSIWWSSIRQEWADSPKVMWSRSGYTKPFFDPGNLGGTDMAYYVAVRSAIEGQNLAHNLNLKLMRYIFKTAKWSGFGNEKVFSMLPALPENRSMTDPELFDHFKLTSEEADYVARLVD